MTRRKYKYAIVDDNEKVIDKCRLLVTARKILKKHKDNKLGIIRL